MSSADQYEEFSEDTVRRDGQHEASRSIKKQEDTLTTSSQNFRKLGQGVNPQTFREEHMRLCTEAESEIEALVPSSTEVGARAPGAPGGLVWGHGRCWGACLQAGKDTDIFSGAFREECSRCIEH